MTVSDRLGKLLAMAEKSPPPPLLLYGIAMEYKKAGEYDRAVDYFHRTIAADAGYCYAYYQLGQTRQLAGDLTSARAAYRDGLAVATRKGDSHAAAEIQAAADAME